ncbi:MAG TPA: YggS family pyridoxal phosphate-dependent enzyme [Victivallales bacterium]|nr:YggS family pyridoxal phosphate-dependent enzyme [Victivallales bacterium]
MEIESIRERIENIRSSIRAAALSSGRTPDDVKLVAVSKNFPPEDVLKAYSCDIRRFGENRVQELEKKAAVLPSDIEWHMIGHLQSNKVIKAVNNAAFIHSVDNLELLKRIEKICDQQSKVVKALIEVNVSGEESKFGTVSEEELLCMCEKAKDMSSLEFCGLMTMAPYGENEIGLRKIFSKLRNFAERLQMEFGFGRLELSMGMSSDYVIAVEEGATIVRIGSAIFGERK